MEFQEKNEVKCWGNNFDESTCSESSDHEFWMNILKMNP